MEGADKSGNTSTDQGNPPQAMPLIVDIRGGYSADQRASEKKHEYEIAERMAYWTKITGIGTVAAAIFAAAAAGLAGVTAYIFWKQLGTMQAQLTAQEADFRVDQRPILGASCKIQLARRISPSLGVVSGRGSGGRGPELREAEYLIDGERDDAEHEVAFDLDRAAHADDPCAEFVLQSGVDAFGHGSKIKEPVVGVGHVDEFHALDFFGPFGLGFVLGAIVAVDDRRMAERLAVVMD